MSTKYLQSGIFKRSLLLLLLVATAATSAQAQVIVYTDNFTNGVAASAAQVTTWNNWRASLLPLPYFKLRVTGSVGPAIKECNDPAIVQDIALKLRTLPGPVATSAFSWVDGPNTWQLGTDIQGRLGVNMTSLSNCDNPGFVIKPGIGNANWGGWGTNTCGGPTQTITIEFFYGVPCSGVPVTSIVGVNEICAGRNFKLSSGNLTGITRQWQYSTNNSTWTNFTGTIDPLTGDITDAITVPTYYRCIVHCIASGQSYTTPVHFVNLAPFYYCYCTGSVATNAAGTDIGNMKVSSLKTGGILLDNGTGTPVLSNATSTKTYTDFRYTVPPIPMYHDSSYLLTVSQILSTAAFAPATAAIYIDYNRNGRFDTWERVLLETTNQFPGSAGIVADTFKVPDTAAYGLTGMRVILRNGTTAPDTCGNYPDGETEDYLVDLRYVPCSGKPIAGIIKGDTSMCDDYDYILTDTTYETQKHGLERAWQVSADGIFWTDIANSQNKDTLMRVFEGQPLYYRVNMVCTHTNDTSSTTVHKVNLKPTYKCYCHSQSLGGAMDTSDAGGFKIYNFEITDGGAHLGNERAVRKRQDYTDITPIEMWVDSIYNFYVFHTMPGDNHSDAKVTVFVDFNNDHRYDIPEERIYTGFTNVGNHTLVGQVIIPNAAIVDVPTGLRVIVNNEVAPNVPSDEACGAYTSGETEDYMVIFRRPFLVNVKDAALRSVALFPNPTSGRFTLSFNGGAAGDVQVKLMTVAGQVVAGETYSHRGGRFMQEMDLSGHAKGIYFVELNAAGIKSTHKVVLQ